MATAPFNRASNESVLLKASWRERSGVLKVLTPLNYNCFVPRFINNRHDKNMLPKYISYYTRGFICVFSSEIDI